MTMGTIPNMKTGRVQTTNVCRTIYRTINRNNLFINLISFVRNNHHIGYPLQVEHCQAMNVELDLGD